MGLGPYSLVTLAEARGKARDAARQLLNGVDPLTAKRGAERAALLNSAKDKTFRECAEAYIQAHEKGWRNPRSSEQWHNTLTRYVYPKIGDLSVAAVDMGLVLSVLEPIWTVVPETASRVRARIEAVLDWAKVRELRVGENPARWKGHLEAALPLRDRLQRKKHFSAMRYADVRAFMLELRGRRESAARLLEFAILTGTRRSEVCGARWGEIEGGVWTIPAHRMKGHREHRVPLCDRALEILAGLPREGEFIFIGRSTGVPVSGMAVLRLLERMGRRDVTMHGFRSTFRDWAAETTAYPNHVVEMALAHAVGNAVEAAYRRGDLFDKRRRLMADWAAYCDRDRDRDGGEVVQLRGA
jgi:integrase